MKFLLDFDLPNVHVFNLAIISFILTSLLLIEYKLSHWYNDKSDQILKYFPFEWNSWECT